MGNNYLTNPMDFVIQTLFGLYILVIMLRFLLQWAKADFYNPMSQFLVKATSPVLRPLRRVIPGFGGLDIASIVLMLALQMLALTISLMLRDAIEGPVYIAIMATAELVNLLINVFIFAIVIQVILSWVSPGAYNPITGLIHSLTEPVMRPARRILPPFSGLDLSPILALIALQVIKMLLMPPIQLLANAVR